MTKIDFYILPQQDEHVRKVLACRLTEKAFRLGHSLYIHTDNQAQCDHLNELLWDFRPDAFLPHDATHNTTDFDKNGTPSIQIGCPQSDSSAHESYHDVLVNLALEIPSFFSRFERVIEIVCQETNILAASRERWTFYQHRGYPLQSHRLPA